MKVLVTGGMGFIGAAVVRAVLAQPDNQVVNLDKLTYAALPERLATVDDDKRYEFVEVDIADREAIGAVMSAHKLDAIIHLAAETHVDRSIDEPGAFIQTNILGTFTLVEEAWGYWSSLASEAQERFRFIHVSTDEVFGPAPPPESFSVYSPYRPSSPYAASKAAADHLVRSWHRTYGFPASVIHCANTYGPYQFPEKLIPLVTTRALRDEPLPIYGQGNQEREWLYIDDCAAGLLAALEFGEPGNSYAIGSGEARQNLEVVRDICHTLNDLNPTSRESPYEDLISHVADRPGHDQRYALDSKSTQVALSWQPRTEFNEGLRTTVASFVDNRDWWQSILTERYARGRLGLGRNMVTQEKIQDSASSGSFAS